MEPPHIYCNLRSSGNGEKKLVQITCSFKSASGRIKSRFSSGLKIEPKFWDENRNSPIAEYAIENSDWYATLKEKKDTILECFKESVAIFGDEITSDSLKEIYAQKNASKTSGGIEFSRVKTLDEFIKWYIEKQESTPYSKRKSEGTLKQYVKILNRLEKYYKSTHNRIYLATASMDEIDACVAWFERQKQDNGRLYAQNTIQDHEKWLIALLNKAVANRFECPRWNPRQSEGRVASADTDDIHFDLTDLQKIMEYKPRNEIERNALVWTVIGYCTGLRHSDWKNCQVLLTQGTTDFGESLTNIQVGEKSYKFLHMCPTKTRKHVNGKGIWCGIPILLPIEKVIEKHGLPKPMVNQLMNRTLKEIAVEAGIDEEYHKKTKVANGNMRVERAMKGEFATTHKIGRVSFITQFAEFIPKPILVKITAHVGGSRDAFDGYIKDQNLKRNAERFISMLKDHQDRGEFGQFKFV